MLQAFNRAVTVLLFAAVVIGLAAFMSPAIAKVIAEADEPGGTGAVIVFHDSPGPFCMSGANLVEYIAKDGSRIPGCYVARGSMLACVFADADRGEVPMSALREPKKT
jgi:hypothetical protein